MMILALVRNYIPSYGWVIRGGWNIADCVERSYDLEGMSRGHGRRRPHRYRRCCGGSRVSTSICTTPIATGFPTRSKKSWA